MENASKYQGLWRSWEVARRVKISAKSTACVSTEGMKENISLEPQRLRHSIFQYREWILADKPCILNGRQYAWLSVFCPLWMTIFEIYLTLSRQDLVVVRTYHTSPSAGSTKVDQGHTLRVRAHPQVLKYSQTNAPRMTPGHNQTCDRQGHSDTLARCIKQRHPTSLSPDLKITVFSSSAFLASPFLASLDTDIVSRNSNGTQELNFRSERQLVRVYT